MVRLVTCSVVVLSAMAVVEGHAQVATTPADSAFVRWVRLTARPLESLALAETPENLAALGNVIQGARLAGLGESIHSMHEFLEARFALVRQLVSHFGYTGVAMETGMPEARGIDAWVTGEVTAEPAFASELGYGFGRDAETVAALRWLREYNARLPKERRVHFYGVDVPANGGGSMLPALAPVWDYLQRTDPAFAATNRARLEGIGRRLASRSLWDVGARYDSLGPARDTLRRGIEELVERIATQRQEYLRRSTADEYAWAARLAEVARQTESGIRAGKLSPHHPRDSAMAANAQWVMERERPRGNVVFLAHNLHVSAERIDGPWYVARLEQLGYTGPPAPYDAMGQILREQLGASYVSIGTAFFLNTADSVPHPADPASLDGLLAGAGLPAFFLDLRHAPRSGAVSAIDRPRPMRAQDGYVEVMPRRSYDAIIFIDRVRASDKAASSTGRGRPPSR